jgi:hypothetical protein
MVCSVAPSVGSTFAFVVRPGYDAAALPLIEFQGDHRADDYPPMLHLLASTLPGLQATAQPNFADEYLWDCRFDGGAFEVSDDWGGLFILAKADHERVIAAVAQALERTGEFRRVVA